MEGKDYLAGLAGLMPMMSSFVGPDYSGAEETVDSIKESLKAQKATPFSFNSTEDLINAMDSYIAPKADYNWKDFYVGKSTGQILSDALGAGLSGAMIGDSIGAKAKKTDEPEGVKEKANGGYLNRKYPLGGMLALGLANAAGSLIGGLINQNEAEERAKKMAEEANLAALDARNYTERKFDLAASNLNNNLYRNALLSNIAAFGGYIGGNGGDWSDGLTFINAGGSHSENPYGGVPVGIAPDGKPDLVEENEVIWNDYVFSDRIKVPKDLSEKYKLNDISFAKAVKKLQKGAEERPNDKIEQDSLNTILSELAQEQEAIRQRRAEKKVMNGLQELADIYAEGGSIHIAKNKRGTFTAAATKHGKSVQGFASQVLAHPENYSPAMVKKANFARNAAKWKHAFGGHLFPEGGWFNAENLRIMPAVGSAIGAALSLSDSPNYIYANDLEAAERIAENKIPQVSYKGISDNLTYQPMDMMFPIAQQQAENAATRSAIMANSNANRQAAMNNLLAANYGANIGLGSLYRQGLDYNQAQRRAVAEFNRNTNQFNAQAYNAANAQNARLGAMKAEMYLNAKNKALQMKNAEDLMIQANRSQALTNLFNNLGDIGIDATNRNWNDMLLKTGYYGTMPLTMKPRHWTKKEWKEYQENVKKYWNKQNKEDE